MSDWEAEPGADVGDDGDVPDDPLLDGDESGGPAVEPDDGDEQ